MYSEKTRYGGANVITVVIVDHFKNLHQNIFKTTKGDPSPPKTPEDEVLPNQPPHEKCYEQNISARNASGQSI